MSADELLEAVLILTPLVGVPTVLVVALLGGPAGWVLIGILVTALLALLFGGVA